jgi:uroporphyrinogen-III decarboxylase
VLIIEFYIKDNYRTWRAELVLRMTKTLKSFRVNKMDSYERFVRVMEFEDTDRTPIFDSIDNDRILREVGGNGPPRKIVPRALKRLGFDATFQGFWAGSEVAGSFMGEGNSWGNPHVLEREWKTFMYDNIVFKKPFILRWTKKYPTTWIVKRPFETVQDILDMEFDLYHSEDKLTEVYFDSYRNIMKGYEKSGIVPIGVCGGILQSLAGQTLGWRLFARAIHQSRDLVRKFMDIHLLNTRANIKAYVEAKAGPAFLFADDIAHKHGLMHSPKFLREEWIPRVKKIIHPALKAGIFVIHHSEGNTEGILGDLVDIGIRGINPLEPFSMDLKKTKEKYGDRLVLTGGIDNAFLLQHGTPTMVAKATKESIKIAAPGSGFCPGSSGNLNPGTPLTNALTLYKTIIRYGAYPSARPKKA